MHKKIILLNSAPNSGKDVAARYFATHYCFHHKEFKAKLFELTKCIYSVSDEDWGNLYTRENKEKPSELLDGLTPRQALIKVSENIIKPNFGKDYFGKAAAKELLNGVNIFSDSGFVEEVLPLIAKVGRENILLVKIFRPGETFEKYNDSRGYLPNTLFTHVKEVVNDTTENDYLIKMEKIIVNWLAGL